MLSNVYANSYLIIFVFLCLGVLLPIGALAVGRLLRPHVLEDAYINRLAKDVPTLVVPRAAIHANHPIHRPDGLLVGDDEQLCALPCGRNDDGH
ncbi:NADH dehydrogenase subunit A [[Flavobacterium] thermophilum]|nr:NADH dehydrogenase subunit A [[Flavobacterium] thermophilum]